MDFQVRRWRVVLRLLVLALIVGTVPVPCWAGPGDQPVQRPGVKASIPSAVRTVAAKRPAPARAQTGTESKAQLGSTSFFRTPAGIAVIGILAAGTGYAVYSASHDRIHSTIPPALK